MMPLRVGFRPTSFTSSREPGCAADATSQKAALEISPGTVKSIDSGTCPPSTVVRISTRRRSFGEFLFSQTSSRFDLMRK